MDVVRLAVPAEPDFLPLVATVSRRVARVSGLGNEEVASFADRVLHRCVDLIGPAARDEVEPGLDPADPGRLLEVEWTTDAEPSASGTVHAADGSEVAFVVTASSGRTKRIPAEG